MSQTENSEEYKDYLQEIEKDPKSYSSFEDYLGAKNGRYGSKRGEETAVDKIYSSWNEKLGFYNFGS